LQGREQFHRLAVGYVVAATGKVGGGLIGLALMPSPIGVLAGTAIGALVAWLVLLPLVVHDPEATSHDPRALSAAAEVVRAGQALLAFFLLTNLDLLAARHYLGPHDAGLYAVGAVVAKGAFWLPAAVPILLLPRLADRQRRAAGLRIGLVAVVAAGAVATGVCAVAGHLVVLLVGGSAYTDLAGDVWLFALAGSLFAVAQLLLYSRLARADHAASALLWIVLAAYLLALVIVRPDSPLGLVLVAVTASAGLVAAGCGVEARRGREGVVDA
jgi:O-antigen/teichoic acid export membrane protein